MRPTPEGQGDPQVRTTASRSQAMTGVLYRLSFTKSSRDPTRQMPSTSVQTRGAGGWAKATQPPASARMAPVPTTALFCGTGPSSASPTAFTPLPPSQHEGPDRLPRPHGRKAGPGADSPLGTGPGLAQGSGERRGGCPHTAGGPGRSPAPGQWWPSQRANDAIQRG